MKRTAPEYGLEVPPRWTSGTMWKSPVRMRLPHGGTRGSLVLAAASHNMGRQGG